MNSNGTVKSSTIIDNTALGVFTGINNHVGSQFGLSMKVDVRYCISIFTSKYIKLLLTVFILQIKIVINFHVLIS